jgi:hypothetical protein
LAGSCTAEATAATLAADPLPCAGLFTVGPAGACGGQVDVPAGPGEPEVLGVPVAAPAEPLVPGDVPVPLPTCEPLPSVLPPPDACPPVSTVELTCTMAWRNGVTANAMLARNATPTSTTTGRSQPASVSCHGLRAGPPVASGPVAGAPPGDCGSRRSRGQGRELSQASAMGQRRALCQRMEAGHCSEAGQRREAGHWSEAGSCSEAAQRTEAAH